MKRLLHYQLQRPLTLQHDVGGELHIRKIDKAKSGLRDHVAKLSRLVTKNCSPEASVDHAAEIQPAFARRLVYIISVDVPQERERSVLSRPSGVRITMHLLL